MLLWLTGPGGGELGSVEQAFQAKRGVIVELLSPNFCLAKHVSLKLHHDGLCGEIVLTWDFATNSVVSLLKHI